MAATPEDDILDRIRAVLPEGCRIELGTPVREKTGAGGNLPPLAGLTSRQRDVLALLLEGMTNKEIGRKLSLSHFTVRNHVSQSLRILNLPSRKAAIARFSGAELDRAVPAAPEARWDRRDAAAS
jgi:Response regulator containing a CheY-like receiver domain and an HTH DNA-binding domain